MYYPGAIEDKKRHAKANQKALDDRLSQPKNAPTFNMLSTRSYIKSAREVRTISDRLYRSNIRCKMNPNAAENKHLDKTIQNIMEINEQFYQDVRKKRALTSHGSKKTLSDLRPFIERLSKPKPRQVGDLVIDSSGKVIRRLDDDDRLGNLSLILPHPGNNSRVSTAPDMN